MKERPILFSGPMVRAILDSTKTQTRRIIKPQPSDYFEPKVGNYCPTMVDKRTGEVYPGKECFGAYSEDEARICLYGKPGDRLWVRETWGTANSWNGVKPSDLPIDLTRQTPHCEIFFKADDAAGLFPLNVWRPSIHMPRQASRITLEIISVRVERLQDISEADAKSEGCSDQRNVEGVMMWTSAKEAYMDLWESINGKGSWNADPWVWVIEFRKEVFA
jgi:hypothetical protein